jgi:hypothetical protein
MAVAVVAVMVLISNRPMTAAAQASPQSGVARRPDSAQNIPLQVQVVISRYQGEKRIGSLPYVLSFRTGGGGPARGQAGMLRLGARVPIRTQIVTPAADGKPSTTANSVSYEQVGTNIDCNAMALEDGRFEVTVSINESSVVTDAQDLRNTPGMDNYPVFRSYQSTNSMFMKDGETTQFTAATERSSGEVIRIEVKLTVVKLAQSHGWN